MPFIDNLAFGLFAISVAGFMLLYTLVSAYLAYNKGEKSLRDHLKDASVPLFFIGFCLFISGLWGQFTWPLPGAYNILFYDQMLTFGIVLLTFSIIGRFGGDMEYVGFLSLLAGIILILYGFQGYNANLTSAPIALLGMYSLYGLAGILAYPVSVIVERGLSTKKNAWGGWIFLMALFALMLLGGSVLAGFIGVEAIGPHLLSPP